MPRQHQFAAGLTICVFLAILCVWGMFYSIQPGMIGLLFAAGPFYLGALLLGIAVWPPDRKTEG